MTLDRERPYVLVGGRHPLVYIQDAYGYDGKGGLLGRVDPAGELIKAPAGPKAPAAEPKRRGRPPKVQGA